jgi:diaminohydroxyphosphoribosylaminopyrimidine deaminase/5-amino-6-(5-phosphoribosylamino)uracil reductase
MNADRDRAMMSRALALAARGLYTTSPNPRVGCVIARDDAVLGEGWHERAGLPHAERLALDDARARGHDVRGATVYVTLEPCNHAGRTPPCVDALLDARVGRVVAAMADPNPAALGGVARLRAAGIAVETGLFAGEARDLNPGFVSRMTRGRPWVRSKLAASLDGRTALAGGASRWITGAEARADGHAWRARVRDPDRHRHRPRRRSRAHRARSADDAPAAAHRRRPSRRDACGCARALRRQRARGHRARQQRGVAGRHAPERAAGR